MMAFGMIALSPAAACSKFVLCNGWHRGDTGPVVG